MSDLVYQNYNNRCQGWVNPSNNFFGPQINSLSSYYSPAGSTTLVSITGNNFYSYSTVSFGTYNPTVYFINSNNLQFYVPPSLYSGIYIIQVFNGSIGSNTINYTIDNASGYWFLNSNGSISNTNINSPNTGLAIINCLSRGPPVTIDISKSPYTVPNNVNWIICDTTNATNVDPFTIVLPSGPQYTGREIMFKNIGTPPVVSNETNNIKTLENNSTNIILPNYANWATLVYDGFTWITMQCNF